MKFSLIAFLIFCSLFTPHDTFAWGRDGHKIVDQVAYAYLTKATRDSVQSYIGSTSFDDAGNWMDEIKSNPDYDYLKPLHYINIEKGQTYVPGGKNIISELDTVIAQLHHREKYSKEQITMDIKILMHLMGDLHQPLHVGYGIDTGGNSIHVDFFGQDYNLHRVWDSGIIKHKNITAENCIKLAQPLSNQEIEAIENIDILQWMNQSRAQLPHVYDFKDKTIDDAYIKKAAPVIEQQMLYAGLRLSHLLNELFKG